MGKNKAAEDIDLYEKLLKEGFAVISQALASLDEVGVRNKRTSPSSTEIQEGIKGVLWSGGRE